MIISVINLEQDELDLLLCITGIAHDFDDSKIIDDVVECLMSDVKGTAYGDKNICREDVTVYARKTLVRIIEKLGG